MTQSLMHRRHFIGLSSTTLVAAAASGLVPREVAAILATEGVNPLLSVGFAQAGSEGAVSVAGASRLAAGDPQLARHGAMVTIHGLQRAGNREAGKSHVHLNAIFSVGDQKIPYLAWSENVSDAPRVKFRVPPSEELTLSIERRRTRSLKGVAPDQVECYLGYRDAAAGEILKRELSDEGKALCVLSVAGRGAKLRPGTYFLALRERAWDRKPHWSLLSADAATLTLHYSGIPADFDYLVVSVERA